MIDTHLRNWHGRDDTAEEGQHATRWHQQVKPWFAASPPGITILGFACDEGVRRNQGRTGAANAPAAIRQWLGNMAWHQEAPVYDAGNITVQSNDLENAQIALGEQVASLLQSGHHPLVIGGGHETAWGTFLGVAAHRPKSTLGIINLDAHFDLRESRQAHSGTPFAQMADYLREQQLPFRYLCLGIAEASNTKALFHRASKLGVKWHTDEELSYPLKADVLDQLDNFINQSDCLYLSTDLDVLPISTMPAVSASAAFGIRMEVVMQLTQLVARSGKLLATDMVEYNPLLDHNDTGARVAARLVWNLARHWRLSK